MTTSIHRILLLGRVASREMHGVRDAVFSIFNDADIRAIPSSAIRDNSIDDDWSPDLVIVSQSQPDEYSASDVYCLLRRFPLARFLCAAGLWCESDGRNRDAWPIGVRVSARIAEQRLRIERAVLDGTRTPLPLTAGREEAFEFDSSSSPNEGVKFGSATVVSADSALRKRFAADLRDHGFDVIEAGLAGPVEVILWDADPLRGERFEDLRRYRQRHSNATIVALANFAPPEDEQRLIRSGADAVCGKLATGAALCYVIAACRRYGTPADRPSMRRPWAS